MLFRLPKCPSRHRLDLHVEKIGQVEIVPAYHETKGCIWRVKMEYGSLANGHTFDFPARESAEAWSDAVAKIVNEATAPKEPLLEIELDSDEKRTLKRWFHTWDGTTYRVCASIEEPPAATGKQFPVMTSDGCLWWEGCAWERRRGIRPVKLNESNNLTEGERVNLREELVRRHDEMVDELNKIDPMPTQAVFRCPKCGGDHFNSHPVHPHSYDMVYVCKGHEPIRVRGETDKHFKERCGWSGPKDACFVNPATPGTQADIQQTIEKYFEPKTEFVPPVPEKREATECYGAGGGGSVAGHTIDGIGEKYITGSLTSPANLQITKLSTGEIEFRIQFADGRGGDFIRLPADIAVKHAARILAMTNHPKRYMEDHDGARLQAVYDQGAKAFADWQPTPEQVIEAVRIYNEITKACTDTSEWTQEKIAKRWLTAWHRVFAQQGEKR